MRSSSWTCLIAAFVLWIANHEVRASIVMAGSSATTPPAFQTGPYLQITPVIDRAHSFTIDANGPYRVDQLQVAAYRLASREPVNAQFAIHADAGGVPGPSLTTFSLSGIPLDAPSILTANPNSTLVLESNTDYWLVGSAMQGQVNWSLAQGVFPMVSVPGTHAYQLHSDPWVVVPNSQLATFAILGTLVPEPDSFALIAAGAISSYALPCRNVWQRRQREKRSWGTRI